MRLAMSAQRLPTVRWQSTKRSSSSSRQAPRRMLGRRWLAHRSRHCFPVRPSKARAMVDQGPSPCA
ncbi:hypothetical protein F751_6949 [Auxenochlorella protothecoides]|uniref:Uncharacterized protein n=1 Tax=Auxenochlorella protothecoides TaxID=3075 RepID=A0A087SR28_AUXPR|nr:hypothetical protein F751_6949 [Auxenochlorella protothecoides]KFM28182.1 hypothetical protein F751_6949 [Auxenochlorella protothecoides]